MLIFTFEGQNGLGYTRTEVNVHSLLTLVAQRCTTQNDLEMPLNTTRSKVHNICVATYLQFFSVLFYEFEQLFFTRDTKSNLECTE